MKPLTLLPVVLLLTLSVASTTQAEPAWGVNCLSCHSEWLDGALYVFGEDAVADPDESGTGAPDRGPLPVYHVAPGQFRTLEVDVLGLGAGDVYAVELKRIRFPGVEVGGELTYSDDCGWAYWGEPGKYYTDPAIGYSWGSGPTTFSFDIGVNFDAPEDFYNLVFAVAGRRASDGSLFSSEEHFYVKVTSSAIKGDFDSDGDVDFDDFDAFVFCFAGDGERMEAGCEHCDLDGDSDVDCSDWIVFRGAWTEPQSPPEFSLCAYLAIPAVSQWGAVVMTLLLMISGTILARGKRVKA